MKNDHYMSSNYKIMADQFMDEKKLRKAVEFYRKALSYKNADADVDLLLNLGLAYEELGQYKSAKDVYVHAAALHPQDARVFYCLGVLYDVQQDYTTAIEYYQKSISLDDSYDRAFFYLANAYDELGDFDSAILYYKKTLELVPDDKYALVNLGSIYEELNQNELALALLTSCLQIDGSYHRGLFNMGVVLNKLGKLADAEFHYLKSIESNPQCSDSFLNLSALYIDGADYDKALQLLEKALEYHPNVADLHYNMACTYSLLSQFALAFARIEPALNLNPELLEYMKTDKEISGLMNYEPFMSKYGSLLNQTHSSQCDSQNLFHSSSNT